MNYDDWKTTPPDMGDGGEPQRFRCLQCHQSFDATSAIRHYDETAHTIVGRRGVVQRFSFTPKCQQVSVEEVVARR